MCRFGTVALATAPNRHKTCFRRERRCSIVRPPIRGQEPNKTSLTLYFVQHQRNNDGFWTRASRSIYVSISARDETNSVPFGVVCIANHPKRHEKVLAASRQFELRSCSYARRNLTKSRWQSTVVSLISQGSFDLMVEKRRFRIERPVLTRYFAWEWRCFSSGPKESDTLNQSCA